MLGSEIPELSLPLGQALTSARPLPRERVRSLAAEEASTLLTAVQARGRNAPDPDLGWKRHHGFAPVSDGNSAKNPSLMYVQHQPSYRHMR